MLVVKIILGVLLSGYFIYTLEKHYSPLFKSLQWLGYQLHSNSRDRKNQKESRLGGLLIALSFLLAKKVEEE